MFIIKKRRGRTRSPVDTRPGKEISTHYDDPTVVAMGEDDGASGMGAPRWGQNKQLWSLSAVLTTVVGTTSAIRAGLDEYLIHVQTRYEKAKARFDSAFVHAGSAVATVAAETAGRRTLHQKAADHGLERPGPRWPAFCFLAMIVLGDLALTSIAMAVLGVSDRRLLPGLPISELHLAAAPVVTGLVASAHVLGAAIREHRDADQRIRAHVKITVGAGLGGALLLALGVAAIRSSYMRAAGIETMTIWFICLQVGAFAVATAISVHSAHPYGSAFRRQERGLDRAVRRFHRLRKRAGVRAAEVNAVVAVFRGATATARAGVEAVSGDTIRAGYLYRRALMHGHPEPVAEPLFEGALPEIELPSSVRELLEYPDVAVGSSLAAPETVNCDDLDRLFDTVQSGPIAPHVERLHAVPDEDEYTEEEA